MKDRALTTAKISKAGIDRILAFIPFFERSDSYFGKAPELEDTQDGGFSISDPVYSKTAWSFVEACYEESFVQPFNWIRWGGRHQDDLRSDSYIGKANLLTIIRMLTTHIRADRFVSVGHLLSVMEDGTILKILKRLEEINSESERL